jgi:hypothetical protein
MMPQSEPPILDDDLPNPWPSLAWIVFAALIAVTAFLFAPLP